MSKNNAADDELKDLDHQIDSLQNIVDRRGKNGVTEADLYRLLESQNSQIAKKSLVDKIYEKDGFMHYWYVKMPAKVLNVGSIMDSQRALNDTIRAIASPMCPMCSKGLMMHKLDVEPVNGKVLWFCSNEGTCGYKTLAEPATGGFIMSGINKVLEQDVSDIAKNRWESLTTEEKAELIESHLSKAVLYKRLGYFLILILLVGLFTKMWFGLPLVLGLLLITYINSLRWCYRAWQIKTGRVYMPSPEFLLWLKTAEKFYSVDWVDENTEQVGNDEKK